MHTRYQARQELWRKKEFIFSTHTENPTNPIKNLRAFLHAILATVVCSRLVREFRCIAQKIG